VSPGRGRGIAPRAPEAGFTLVEMMVSSTLVALLLALLVPAWRSVLREEAYAASRMRVLSEIQVARAAVLADAASATGEISCAGEASALSLSMGIENGVPWGVEYRHHDGNLYRWRWPSDEEMLVARGVDGLSCVLRDSHDVAWLLSAGGPSTPYRLQVALVQVPPEEGGP